MPTPLRNVRVPDVLWDAAKAKAASEDPPRSVSDVLVTALQAYVAG